MDSIKKWLLICSFGLFISGLSGCSNATEQTHENTNTEIIIDTHIEDIDTSMEIETESMDYFGEYQLNFYLVSTDPEGNKMEVDMDIYHKGENSRYIINQMPTIPDSPLQTYETLVLWDTTYVKMWVNDQKIWFKAEGVEATQLDDQLFDLEEVQAELTADADDIKQEKIDSKTMTCYYRNDGVQNGKACIWDGIFTYAESITLDGSEIKTVMNISDYKKTVDDQIFAKPTDVRDMVELMEMMLGK
jgi:hypothetical protein